MLDVCRLRSLIRRVFDMHEWIPVEERLPAIGEWVNLIRDITDDPWAAVFATRWGVTLRSVVCGSLRYIDSEGHPEWEQGRLASGRSLISLNNITHWQSLPLLPDYQDGLE